MIEVLIRQQRKYKRIADILQATPYLKCRGDKNEEDDDEGYVLIPPQLAKVFYKDTIDYMVKLRDKINSLKDENQNEN